MFLWAERKGIHVDARIGGTGVVLPRLNNIEVGPFALGEAVLAVELELGSHYGVLAPAVHVEGSLGEDERARIGYRGAVGGAGLGIEGEVGGGTVPVRATTDGDVSGTGHLEEARGGDELVAAGAGSLGGATEGMDGLGEGVDGIRVVEGLGTESAVEEATGIEGRAVVNVGIGLDNPDKLLAGVVEVELDLVGGGADRLVTRELELLNEILVGVLGHLAALVRVEEDVVNVEGSGNKGLLVSLGYGDGSGSAVEGLDGPEALTKRADVKVDLDLVVLEGDEGEGKAGVAAKPEKEGDVESGLGEGVAGGANLVGATGGGAGAGDSREVGVSDVGELGGVANHLPVALLLLAGKSELVPDVHPVTVLAVNALATNLDLNLGDELLTDVA